MYDRIVVMAQSDVDAQRVAQELHGYAPTKTVDIVHSLEALIKLGSEPLSKARLVSFANPTIIPGEILAQLGFGGYNFHMGPPDYRGWAPPCFAVYNGARKFGATAHVMSETIDGGPIVGVETFDFSPDAHVTEVLRLTMIAAWRLFVRLGRALAMSTEPLPDLPIAWSGRLNLRRHQIELCDVGATISKDELDRRIVAFGSGIGGLAPTVNLHGHRFIWSKCEVPER